MCIPQGKSTGYDVGIGSKKRRKRERGAKKKKNGERKILNGNIRLPLRCTTAGGEEEK